MQEYLAGTYAFDPADGFRVDFKRMKGAAPVLEFLALRGRAYSMQTTTNLVNWNTMRFRIPAHADPAALRTTYSSTDVQMLEVEAEPQPAERKIFYRLLVQ